MKKSIGILGGMGPLATADIFRKIVLNTKACSDGEHIRVYIDNNPAIPDRTAAILRGGRDPVPEMLSCLRNLEKCGADVVIMPCNTAHFFLPRLQNETKLPFISMPAAAAEKCAEYKNTPFAILATEGTLDSGIYQPLLEKENVPAVIPDSEEKKILTELIYGYVKAGADLAPAKPLWENLLAGLKEKGAGGFILGCTELPILYQAFGTEGIFVDPTLEVAKAAIIECGFETV